MAVFNYIKFTTKEYPAVVLSNKMIKPAIATQKLSSLKVGDKVIYTPKSVLDSKPQTLEIATIVSSKYMGW